MRWHITFLFGAREMFRLHIPYRALGSILLATVSFNLSIIAAQAQELTHAQEYEQRAQYDQTQLQGYLDELQPYAQKLNEQDKNISVIKVKLAQSKKNSADSKVLQNQLNQYFTQRAISQSYVQQLQGYIDAQQRLIAEDRSIIQQSSISDTADEAYQEALQEQQNLGQIAPNNNPALNDEDDGWGNGGYGGYGYGGYGHGGGYSLNHGSYSHSSSSYSHVGHSSGHSGGSHGGGGRR